VNLGPGYLILFPRLTCREVHTFEVCAEISAFIAF